MAAQPDVVEGYHNQIRFDVVHGVPRTTGTLVDVGGGTGATAMHMKTVGLAGRVGVIDRVASEDAIPELDFHHSGELEDEQFLAGVIEREGPFDTILVLDILEHLVDPWRVVAQLHQALKPGGHMVASIPNVRHYRVSGGLFFRNRWKLGDAGILDRTHLRFFVRETAVELMTHSGLVLEAVEPPQHTRHQRERALFNKVTFGKLSSFIDVQYLVRVRRDDGAAPPAS
jgi:2-polyprenyl-3-methyl-5-hydroxy-6-metoxy-1,4-benzoquinol methylase